MGFTTQTKYSLAPLQPDHTYCLWVAAIDTSGTVTASSNQLCRFAKVLRPSNFIYLAEVTSNERDIETYTLVDGTADLVSYRLERATNPIGPFVPVASIPVLSGPPYQLVINDFSASPASNRYFYRLSTIDSCGAVDTTSNVSRNILLEIEKQGNLTNILRWNPYTSWQGTVARYEVYRSIDNDYSYVKIADVANTDTTFFDVVRDAGSTNGQFCYYIKAIETGNPLGVVNPDGGPIESNSNAACVIHEARVFVPAAFAPNSEIAENQIFKPSNLFAQPGSYRMYLMNRWGEVVFDTRDIDMGWDGTHNGQQAPVGSYVYIIEYRSLDGLPVILRGTFTLVP
jgi:gliding motility-associated-like protein